MPTSPCSQRMSRRLSSNDVSAPNSPIMSHSRRSSQYSLITRYSSNRFSADLSGLHDNGIGNLADELANAWASDEDVGDAISEIKEEPYSAVGTTDTQVGLEDGRKTDSGVDLFTSVDKFQTTKPLQNFTIRPGPSKHSQKHSTTTSQSEDVDSENLARVDIQFEISPTLNAMLVDIENFSKIEIPSGQNGSHNEDDLYNLGFLNELGAQSSIETCAMRLAKAQTAISMNLANQTRALQSLSHVLLSPLSFGFPEIFIDELLQLVISSVTVQPQPNAQVLSSLKRLGQDSRDIVGLLKNLYDTLHMCRQTSEMAARRLKSARELVAELSREAAAFENGRKWIEEGQWETRLAQRQCASACKDVVRGFEQVCNEWRDRIVAGAA